MVCFIKKIVEGNVDEFVHIQFQKFSRGEFKNRACVVAKKSKDKYAISTTPEYVNQLVKDVALKIPPGEKVSVKGIIVSTADLSEEIKFQDKKQFMGIKKYIIEDDFGGEQIVGMIDKIPTAFFGLSFSVGNTELKIKPKLPKTKPSGKEENKPKVDFCKLKTKDIELVRGILFDIGEFKKVEIVHDFLINEIEIPKDETESAKMREKAIRKGKIVRKISVDGIERIKEIEFEA